LAHLPVKSQEVGAEIGTIGGAVAVVLGQGQGAVIGKVRLNVSGRKLLKLHSLLVL